MLLSCFFLPLWSRVDPSTARVLSACLASESRMNELLPQDSSRRPAQGSLLNLHTTLGLDQLLIFSFFVSRPI
ncbi:hypothetical protein PVAP13_3NG220571 [Panicum virgatum]|uniref:Secreted protein n=1 Tax=Panicum virgatum TaxID=38727 RepID=A0A8T0UCW6_PANVG|nr:hypothetical protein PVAP13_3NG220571 [Panicum virgatum]